MNELPYLTEDLGFALRVFIAALLAAVLGWERETTGKAAGLRTHILVGISAALLMTLGDAMVSRYAGDSSALRLNPFYTLSAIATGVSFLGAGTVFVSRNGVQGLTTAASILATATVGAAVGIERYALAVAVTLLVLLTLRLSSWIETPAKTEPPPTKPAANE